MHSCPCAINKKCAGLGKMLLRTDKERVKKHYKLRNDDIVTQ